MNRHTHQPLTKGGPTRTHHAACSARYSSSSRAPTSKDNAQIEVGEERKPPQNRNLLKDPTIRLTSTGARDKCPPLLRRIGAVREDRGDILVALINHHGLDASPIAAISKDRRQIEWFFTALNQHLKI